MSRDKLISRVSDYALSVQTGTMAAGLAAAAEVMQFRWTSSTRRCAVLAVICNGVKALGTGFTAGAVKMAMSVARSFTAAGTGGATATITTNNGKMMTDQGTTALGELRIATTAALTAGTKTLDDQPVGILLGVAGTAAHSVLLEADTPLFVADPDNGQSPLILEANEGFAIMATVPATGTWDAAFTIKWAELD